MMMTDIHGEPNYSFPDEWYMFMNNENAWLGYANVCVCMRVCMCVLFSWRRLPIGINGLYAVLFPNHVPSND